MFPLKIHLKISLLFVRRKATALQQLQDGTAEGKLLGLVTTRDYRVSRMSLDTKVSTFMTPIDKLVTAPEGTSLKEANDIIWDNKINQLPIVNKDGRLVHPRERFRLAGGAFPHGRRGV